MDLMSINAVAARLGLSVHQLRRWELMFGLEIKRGRGQQRQYRSEDLSVLERIKELVEQGWPTSQIRPQLEADRSRRAGSGDGSRNLDCKKQE